MHFIQSLLSCRNMFSVRRSLSTLIELLFSASSERHWTTHLIFSLLSSVYRNYLSVESSLVLYTTHGEWYEDPRHNFQTSRPINNTWPRTFVIETFFKEKMLENGYLWGNWLFGGKLVILGHFGKGQNVPLELNSVHQNVSITKVRGVLFMSL